AEFSPLRSLNQSNLPEQPTPFVGREKEFAEVLTLVRDERIRLVTLTGAGGSGKTRLAVQAAAEAVDDHEHGVWWVGLQAVRDPEVVLPTIGSTIGADGDLAAHIGDRRMLLVLDNLEQVLGAAPELGGLAAACPNLRMVVTSRELLLTGGARDLPERQRTLRSAIAWSHELLEPQEQQLFRRLAVFSGGCTLEAAEKVTGGDLDGLQSLVEKSLLRFDGDRYSLLE